jgi:hypothetical protein
MAAIDYLAIGHVTQDLTPAGPTLGGSATFSGLTAHALGLRTALITSAPEGHQPLLGALEILQVHRVPAENFTTFKNVYISQGRVQTLLDRAEPLLVDYVPSTWRTAPIVHLAPVADEVDPALVESFPNALLGVTPQGWMRRWDETGRVMYQPWRPHKQVLSRADVVILSIEDLGGNETRVRELAEQAHLLVVTRSEHGCTLFVDSKAHSIPAPRVEVQDPTGAGDIFAAAFLARLHATRRPFSAARFATALASASVTRVGLASIPTPSEIEQALAQS